MNIPSHPLDTWWLYAGAVLIALSTIRAWRGLAAPGARGRRLPGRSLPLTDLALAAVAVGIALRWARIGHGPFLNLFEILASSLLSLGIIWRVASMRIGMLRDSAPMVLSLLTLLAAWLVVADASDTVLPPTYEMPILWLHLAMGKVFLGCALIAAGLAGVLLARSTHRGAHWFRRMPDDAAIDAVAWRFMLSALVFESLMLIAGAIWAQDAWGRFWAWDPLETWAFTTWLALAAAVHARISWRLRPRTGAIMIFVVFLIAFLTFFGIPFVSLAPHKGAV